MPCKERDAFHTALREFIQESCIGMADRTPKRYRSQILEAGELLDFKPPLKITLPEMRMTEAEIGGNENSRAIKASTFRQFLRWCGNRDAQRWKLSCKQRPKEDGVFFGEAQTAYIREFAQKLGNVHELMYSLGIDNGLRCIDMQRLTPARVDRLIRFGKGKILGKGRNGGKEGMLYLNRLTYAPLVQYVQHRKELVEKYGYDPEQFLIRETRHGKPRLIAMNYGDLLEICNEISKEAKMEFDPHDLRRSYGNRLHLAGKPLETIAKLMRHESPDEAFKSYIGWFAEEFRAAQDSLCPAESIQQLTAW